jgi:hypothetical protein
VASGESIERGNLGTGTAQTDGGCSSAGAWPDSFVGEESTRERRAEGWAGEGMLKKSDGEKGIPATMRPMKGDGEAPSEDKVRSGVITSELLIMLDCGLPESMGAETATEAPVV